MTRQTRRSHRIEVHEGGLCAVVAPTSVASFPTTTTAWSRGATSAPLSASFHTAASPDTAASAHTTASSDTTASADIAASTSTAASSYTTAMASPYTALVAWARRARSSRRRSPAPTVACRMGRA